MLKRLLLLAGLLSFVSPAFAAGTVPLSLTQQFDNSTHLPLSGGKLYLIQAGTTSTPQNCYQDSGLTIAYANPLTLDSGGRVPQLFCADGTIKLRLTNSAGVQQLVQDNIMVIGASSGGGGGGSVDATTILATGDVKSRYGTGTLAGFVRMNGRTIGSATSGATERANADAQALFEYLWQSDANLVVSTGRGASSAADWAANKTIALPDGRGRVLAGLDDMGSSAAGRLTATYFGSAATTLGVAGGSQSHTITIAEAPAHTFSGTTSTNNVGHTHTSLQPTLKTGTPTSNGGGSVWLGADVSTSTTGESAPHTHTFGGTTDGGGGAHSIVPPMILVTNYIKL